MKVVLVIVTRPVGVCSTCDHYKASQELKLMQLLKGQTNVRVITLTASSTVKGDSFLEKEYYHPQMLTVYWKWWPSFFLFTEESWKDPNSDLKGYILGGKLGSVNGEPKMVEDIIESKYSSLALDIFSWTTEKMNKLTPGDAISYNSYITDIRTNMKRRGSF